MASDWALVTGAAEIKWLNGWSAAATFEGEFSNVTGSYAGKGVDRALKRAAFMTTEQGCDASAVMLQIQPRAERGRGTAATSRD